MKLLLSILSFICSATLYGQGSVGLIAHWNMNGTVNDISGNGHNGTANNITSAVGINGIAGTAYAFNGVNSYITVPYSTDLNTTKYTICATVKILGFYDGLCQSNVIITRGKPCSGNLGSYALLFDDNAYDTTNCYAIDSTKDVFYGNAGSLVPSTSNARYYTPAISKNNWYKVVVVFNDTTYKTFVNGVLKNTAIIPTPGISNGSSTDSICIGYNIYESAAYPYQFNGVIDDIRLYNRALSDTEVITYNPTFINGISNDEPEISIFPNPAHEYITITGCKNSLLKIYDVMGKEIKTCSLVSDEQQISTNYIPCGIYFLRIMDKEYNTKTVRFLKE